MTSRELHTIQSTNEAPGCSDSISQKDSTEVKDFYQFYGNMNFESLLQEASELDVSLLDNTRNFQQERRQRWRPTQSGPVPKEHRKEIEKKNSRDYTKRNRDEVATCQILFNNTNAMKFRFEEVLFRQFNSVEVVRIIDRLINDYKSIFGKYLDLKEVIVPSADQYFKDYKLQLARGVHVEITDSGPNRHKEKYEELMKQLDELSQNKGFLVTSTDKLNYGSQKCRLNQRVKREKLKMDCWDCWKEINIMIERGKRLQECQNQLKKEIWTNILAVLHNLLQQSKQHPTIPDALKIESIIDFFAPFSIQNGSISVKWSSLENEVKVEEEPGTSQGLEEKPEKIEGDQSIIGNRDLKDDAKNSIENGTIPKKPKIEEEDGIHVAESKISVDEQLERLAPSTSQPPPTQSIIQTLPGNSDYLEETKNDDIYFE